MLTWPFPKQLAGMDRTRPLPLLSSQMAGMDKTQGDQLSMPLYLMVNLMDRGRWDTLKRPPQMLCLLDRNEWGTVKMSL